MFVDELEEEENNQHTKQTFLQITQVVEVALAVTAIQANNNDHYVWKSKQGVVFFEIFVCEIKHFF